jgi:phosphatidylserine/phosphatidylglycerophosphate/cardiolipin synthase-like enzyme
MTMADIDTLINDFFVNLGDVVQAASSPGSPDVAITAATLPQSDAGVRITHLIDGINYFGALKAEVAALKAGGTDRFFYSNSWCLGTSPTPNMVPIGEGTLTSAWRENAAQFVGNEIAFQLEDSAVGPFHPFQEDIRAMSDSGVDVRFLVWASPFLVNFKAAATAGGAVTLQYWGVNVHSLRSVLDLRQIPSMSNKVVLNTLAHTLGAMHLKMVVCGDSTGFRGYVTGIDFTQIRNAIPTHQPRPGHDNRWHDLAVKVEGTAASALHLCFEQLWNEQVRRSPKTFKAFGAAILSHVDDTPFVDPRETAPITNGTMHTQVLRTLPTMNFAFFGTDRAPVNCIKRLITGFKQEKIAFAPGGVFEFRAAQRKAVKAARRYIYIEDQAMENLELAPWINERLKAVPELKVILVYGGDPLDPASPDLPDMMDRMIDGLTDPAERIVFVKASYIVHSKVTIIDDLWASIGSSNCWVRSFYTDGEINVSVLDEADPPFAARLRKDLWGELCNITPGPDCDPLLPLDDALGIWRASWGTPPGGFTLSAHLARRTVPFVFAPPPAPPEAFPEPRPTPSQEEREQQDSADSRLEY